MQKNDFLTFLTDPDICQEIYDIIRHSGRPTGSAITAKASGPPNKVTFLTLLHDVDICREIFNIILRAGKAASPDDPTPKAITSSGVAESAMSLREQIRNRITNRNLPATTLSTAPEKPVDRKTMFADRLKLMKDRNTAKPGDNSSAAIVQSEGGGIYTLITNKICPLCSKKTKVVQVRPNLVAETLDFDFCAHFQDFNPYLYTIWVCEHCGYVANEEKFQERMPERFRRVIKPFLEENNFRTPFVETRDKEEALALYEMAIYFNEMSEKSPGRQALLYQKMAWVCRIEDDMTKEHEYLLRCAELFEQSVGKEHYPIGKITDDYATYIIGVNYYMLGDFDKATKTLNALMSSRNFRMALPKLYEKARDVIQDMRRLKSSGSR